MSWSRISQPRQYWHWGLHSSLSRGLVLGTAGRLAAASLALPPRCQEHLPSCDNQKYLQALANGGGGGSYQFRTNAPGI